MKNSLVKASTGRDGDGVLDKENVKNEEGQNIKKPTGMLFSLRHGCNMVTALPCAFY